MSITPKNGETSLSALIRAWKAGVSQKTILISFGDLIPQIVASLFGLEAAYWRSHKKHGWAAPFAPHNLYRQIFHIAGGFLLALLLGFWGVLLVVGYAAFKEAGDARKSSWNLKNTLDFSAWLLGALAGALCP